MRILFIAPYLPSRIRARSLNFIVELARRGHEITLVAPRKADEQPSDDLLSACQAEAGDFILAVQEGQWSWEHVHGSLGDVVVKRVPGRETEDEITLFKSVGLAIQDISVAYHVHQRALAQGVGGDFAF